MMFVFVILLFNVLTNKWTYTKTGGTTLTLTGVILDLFIHVSDVVIILQIFFNMLLSVKCWLSKIFLSSDFWLEVLCTFMNVYIVHYRHSY